VQLGLGVCRVATVRLGTFVLSLILFTKLAIRVQFQLPIHKYLFLLQHHSSPMKAVTKWPPIPPSCQSSWAFWVSL